MSQRIVPQSLVIDALQASNWNSAIFQELVEGKVTAIHVTLAFWHDCQQTLGKISKWNQWFREYDDLILLVNSTADILEAHRTSRVGIIFGFQNSSPIEDNLGFVEIFHKLGVKIMQLTYNNQSLVGAGCYEKVDGGLTNFGRNVIQEMNRLGMVIDVSHTGEKTSFDAIEYSQDPIAVTHANPLSFRNVLRNKSNEFLVELAKSGGMLGFSLYPLHLKDGSNCTLESFCEMVASTVDLMGIDHVGMGSDLCLNWGHDYLEYMRSGTWNYTPSSDLSSSSSVKWPDYPSWFSKAYDFKNITTGLQKYGFAKDEIAKIMGLNWFKYFEKIW